MKYLVAFPLLLCAFFATSQQIEKHTVYFAVDKSAISQEELQRLDNFVNEQKSKGEIASIQLTGHTDSDASSAYNLELSKKRVNEVRKHLIDLASNDKIVQQFVGEDQPLNKNLTEEEKKQNRRVDVSIEYKVAEPKAQKTIQDLYKQLEQEKQSFCIDPKGDTTIVLAQGTMIYFPPEPFNKKGNKCIVINAKEFYKKSDMILENLSTISDGNLLESGGMIYVEALDSYSKKPMQLAAGKQITIALPTDSLRDDMRSFFGERDPHSHDMNWTMNDLQAGGISLTLGQSCAEFIDGRGLRYCEPCRFFFCRIKRFGKGVKGVFNAMQRAENRSYRQCLRNSRRNIPTYTTIPVSTDPGLINQCAKLDSLFKTYGVDNYESLVLAMNKQQMEKYGVKTLAQLRDTLNKIRMAEAESNMAAGTSNYADRQYFILNSTKMGWINCDAFSNQSGAKIVMNTDLDYDPQTDCKVVFTSIKGIMPAGTENGKFSFANVPAGKNIWLIGIRYIDDKIFLSMTETKSAHQVEFAKFRQVTVEELKQELGKMD